MSKTTNITILNMAYGTRSRNKHQLIKDPLNRLFSRESEGVCFYRHWFVSVCVCVSMTIITRKIVNGFVPNFTGRFLGGKGRSSSCFVTIGRGMWK